MARKTRTAAREPDAVLAPDAPTAAEIAALVRDRVVEFRKVRVSTLIPHPENWRLHGDEQREAIRGLFTAVGFAGVILTMQVPEGLMVLDGHLRVEELPPQQLVNVAVTDLSMEEGRLLLATFDRVSQMAGQDSRALANLVLALEQTPMGTAALKLVWPEYILDPLRAADWTPPAPGDLSSTAQGGKAVSFSSEQWLVVHGVCELVRQQAGDHTITDAQALLRVCEAYDEEHGA